MIVKIRTMDNGWIFYEAANAKVRPLTCEQYENGINFNTPHRIEVDVDNLYASDGKIFVKVININNGKTIIYTNKPSYLLNDNGKTIETLNN